MAVSVPDESANGGCGIGSLSVWGIVSITACLLIQSTLGVTYTYSNLAPYMTSYLRKSTNDSDLDYTQSIWIAETANIAECIFMPFVGVLYNHISRKLYLFLGIVFFNFSLAGCYWSLDYSFWLTVLTFGALRGMALAILFPACVHISIGWAPCKMGLVSGITLAGYGFGSFAMNEFITMYINKDNLKPEVKYKEDYYYIQREVLDNVPYCLVLLSAVCGCIQLISLAAMREPPVLSSDLSNTKESGHPHSPPALVRKESKIPLNTEDKSYGTLSTDSLQATPNIQYQPLEVLRSRVFWTIWLMTLSSQMAFIFVTNLLKAYGQTFIRDDHFLSLVASLSCLFNGLGRLVWGVLADKFSFRVMIVFAQCVLALLIATVVLCEDAHRVMYCIWVCGMYTSMCGIITLIPPLIYDLFGSKNFSVNLGLKDTNRILGAIFAGVLASPVKSALGWHGIFFVAFLSMFGGFLLNLSLSINYKNSIPRHMYKALSLQRELKTERST